MFYQLIIKQLIMKKTVFAIALIAVLTACGSNTSKVNLTVDSTKTVVDTVKVDSTVEVK
jgi:uncharacterized lipoprotein YajG